MSRLRVDVCTVFARTRTCLGCARGCQQLIHLARSLSCVPFARTSLAWFSHTANLGCRAAHNENGKAPTAGQGTALISTRRPRRARHDLAQPLAAPSRSYTRVPIGRAGEQGKLRGEISAAVGGSRWGHGDGLLGHGGAVSGPHPIAGKRMRSTNSGSREIDSASARETMNPSWRHVDVGAEHGSLFAKQATFDAEGGESGGHFHVRKAPRMMDWGARGVKGKGASNGGELGGNRMVVDPGNRTTHSHGWRRGEVANGLNSCVAEDGDMAWRRLCVPFLGMSKCLCL